MDEMTEGMMGYLLGASLVEKTENKMVTKSEMMLEVSDTPK